MNKDAMGNFPPDKKAESPTAPHAKGHPSPEKPPPMRKDESGHDALSEKQQDVAANAEVTPAESEKQPIKPQYKDLPVRRVRINGEELTGRFDGEKGLVYLDDGRVVRVKPAAPPISPAAAEEAPEREAQPLPGAVPIKRIATPGYGEDDDDAKKRSSGKKARSASGAVKIVVACGVLLAATAGFIKFGMPFIVQQTTSSNITSVIVGDE